MIDEVFIDNILQRGKVAKQKVQDEFFIISAAQLNWKPRPDSWSIAQCLEHLINSHDAYTPDLQRITAGTFTMNWWEKYSPFSRACGRMMINNLQEEVKRKMTAPKKIQPTTSNFGMEIMENYDKSLDSFLEYIANCRGVDIDKTIITSPILAIVTYSLRDAFQFLLQHEHRHLNQAVRLKVTNGFPVE